MRGELGEAEGDGGKGTLCVHTMCYPTSHNTLIFTGEERQANSLGLHHYNPLLLIHEDKCPWSDQPSCSLYACARCCLVSQPERNLLQGKQAGASSSDLPTGVPSTRLSILLHPLCSCARSWQVVHPHPLGGAGLGEPRSHGDCCCFPIRCK